MKIAVTGAAGYIGQLLIERLAARPEVDKITAIDLHRPARMPAKVEFHSCDIRDRKLVKLLEGADVIIHLAFIVAPIHDLQATYSINVGGSRNLLAAAEAVQPEKLIVASSVAAYGIQPPSVDIITEDTPLRGDSSSYYLHSKRLVEEHLDVFEKRNPQIVLTRGSENSVAYGMQKNIGVGMPPQAFIERYLYSPDKKRPVFHQAMNIVSYPYSHFIYPFAAFSDPGSIMLANIIRPAEV